MTAVFVSNSRTDRPRAQQLAHVLEAGSVGCETPLGKTVDESFARRSTRRPVSSSSGRLPPSTPTPARKIWRSSPAEGLSLAASYGESVESSTGVKATELLKWLEESLGGSEAAEPGDRQGQVDVRRENR